MSTARAAEFFGATAWSAGGGVLRRSLATVVAMIAALAAATAGAQSDTPAANQLQDVRVETLPGNQVQLELKMSGTAPTPLSFTIDNPARIALDLPDTSIALANRRKDVGAGALTTILAAESGGRTRVVLNLSQMVPYETRVSGNSVFV